MARAKTTIRDCDVLKTWCLQSTLNFTCYMFKAMYKRNFEIGRHHKAIAAQLDRVLRGECTRLIINIAPRFGKTELAVKNFIAMGLAINPKANFVHLLYSNDLALDNSRGVQDIVGNEAYQRIFPGTVTKSKNAHKWKTTAGGGLYAVSSAGQVTGFGAGLVDESETQRDSELGEAVGEIEASTGSFGGAIVIDDPIKPDDARSNLIREKVNQKFETTIRNRVNSRNTPIIIIMQRLDENDLCGYLMKLEPEKWEVLSLPCIYTDEKGNERSLWPFKFTLKELYELREKNAWVFDTQYMQNPKPLEGLMYESPFKTYTSIPFSRVRKVLNYTDTADTGEDYLCSIDYIETDTADYVLDVLYTQRPMEYTETKTAEMMSRDNVEVARIESNNGGRGFARNVERTMREMGNNRTKVHWFYQGDNKQARIFTHSAEVQNLIYFPEGWEKMWPEFHRAIIGYMKIGTNAHDDGPDVLTGIVEWRDTRKHKSALGYF